MYYDDGTVVPFDVGSAVIATKTEDWFVYFRKR